MIKVHSTNNGLGNKMFEYALGRILAEELGFKLNANPLEGFPNTNEIIDGEQYSQEDGFPVEVIKGHEYDITKTLGDNTPREIQVSWPLQRYEAYAPFMERIKKWFAVEPLTLKPNKEDIVIHIRRGDYVKEGASCNDKGYALPFSFYEKLLLSLTYKNIFVVTDDPQSEFFNFI